MKRVIRIVRAVPWATLWRFSFKALCMLGAVLIAVLGFAWKAIVYLGHFFLTLLEDEQEKKSHVATATSIPDDAPSWVRHDLERDPNTTIYY